LKLTGARLCLDCEEIHDAAQCPICASETFAFLTRWVPSHAQRPRMTADTKPASPSAQRVLVGAGIIGGIAYLVNRWLTAAHQKIEEAADSKPSGELR
jgi:hypothetical protein